MAESKEPGCQERPWVEVICLPHPRARPKAQFLTAVLWRAGETPRTRRVLQAFRPPPEGVDGASN